MTNVIVRESEIEGNGVYSLRAFAPGEVILEIDDSRVVDAARPLHPELGEYERHCDYLADGKVVLMQSPERHINSSCDPNTYVKTIDGVRCVIARRAISPGEEITYDYVINLHGGIVWQCSCGSPLCRKTVPGSFFDLPLEQQRAYLPLLDDWFVQEHREKLEKSGLWDETF